MDKLLHKIWNTFAFIDDILIVTKGSKKRRMQKVEQVMRTQDESGNRLKLANCKFAQEQTEWLGSTLPQRGIKLINDKVQASTDELNSET